jgi:hypothetical protein
MTQVLQLVERIIFTFTFRGSKGTQRRLATCLENDDLASKFRFLVTNVRRAKFTYLLCVIVLFIIISHFQIAMTLIFFVSRNGSFWNNFSVVSRSCTR